jgi:glycosyltransferase involved in cell wall biosynthesis
VRIGIVSTYHPRPCGIAMFASDLRRSLVEGSPGLEVGVASIVREKAAERPIEVITTIRQDVASDYAAAASTLSAQVDVVLIEHEFGIFGGVAGDYVLTLVRELTVPFVVTLHTVLSAPSVQQAAVLRALCYRAAMVTVFTETARQMVTEAQLADPTRVTVVPHGAPDMLVDSREAAVRSDHLAHELPSELSEELSNLLAGLEGRAVLATFGLISPSKGLELVVNALPSIVASCPEACYLIAGKTHPEVVRQQGESYRLQLEQLVSALGLSEHVLFLDRFLSIEELGVLLARTDLYLTPYRSREQIVSGALTFAVAAGCAVVSTPYFYAQDLLASGAGVLVPFGDSAELARAATELLRSPTKMGSARSEARRVGAGLAWSSVGKVIAQVLAAAAGTAVSGGHPCPPLTSPPRLSPTSGRDERLPRKVSTRRMNRSVPHHRAGSING